MGYIEYPVVLLNREAADISPEFNGKDQFVDALLKDSGAAVDVVFHHRRHIIWDLNKFWIREAYNPRYRQNDPSLPRVRRTLRVPLLSRS
jgi:hypothetical protein